ncbi:MAG TPA: MSMEG_3727 family PQQ-associated protein [Longimicrobium sp.]|jgi:PQQ system protein|uniref:MSMEG_3727 family PQQ-associated protein n=1 Tax=Longimicrobium sp. TaxID=2029185 RepID=UPI002EDA7BBF
MTLARVGKVAGLVLLAGTLNSCNYVRLLRPSVLRQLNPRMVDLVNYLPEVDDQNEAIVGRLFAHGGLSRADRGPDGVYRQYVRIPPGEYIWQPAIIVMPAGGELELEFQNDDPWSYHAVLLPNSGNRQAMTLPINTRGRARIRLDAPGYYWFGCPVANHATRGMLGLVLVEGEVPAEARLDRPRQRRP